MTKEDKILRIQKFIFAAMLFSVIMLFALGEILMPRENPTESGSCRQAEVTWEWVHTDGTREVVQVPGRYEGERNKPFRLETTVPVYETDTWLCMRASQQDMRIYVEEQLRKEYTTKETRLFGRNSASSFVFCRILREDAGKTLAIELTSDSEYAGFLNAVYIGDKFDIAREMVRECTLVLLVSLYMLILSTIAILIGCILRVGYNTSVDITYLGLGTLALSIAMLSESRIRQFFLPNASVASHVGFLLTMLVPYPFIVYMNRIQKNRYKKIYEILSWIIIGNFALSNLLEMLDLWNLEDSVTISYVLIVVMVLLMGITIIWDMIKGRAREYGELLVGFIAMIVVALWETYLNFVPQSSLHGGIALSFGLIILLFVAGFKAARDILSMENEKKVAILASETKAQFIANMSHEIRTPINTIIGMNEMILRENQNEEVAEYAENVQNASKLLLGLINDILDFSKIEAGKMDILNEKYHLSGMLSDVIKGTRMKADMKGLVLQVQVDEKLPSVLRGDEIRIRQILNNLLSNAVKYTKEGTISLTVQGVYEQEQFCLQMQVEDTGMGIKTQDLHKLFTSFQRLEEKKNRFIEGTGLGLNITKQLVELMGGSIAVNSEYGKGSCFLVTIPQRVEDATPMGNPEEARRRELAGKTEKAECFRAPWAKLLVVDDNNMNLAVVKALLKRTEVQLTLAHGGGECLELCKKEKFDLILMDHMMPAPDGIETLHLLREDESSPNQDTAVIVLTANAIAGAAERYMAEGFGDYLSKPIVAEELEDMLRRFLKSKKQEQEMITKDNPLLQVDKTVGLEYCGNDEEIYRDVLEEFYAQGEEYLEKLHRYYEVKDWPNYRIIVHALKNNAMTIGAVAMSAKAKELEMASAAADEAILLAECEGFYRAYETFIKER